MNINDIENFNIGDTVKFHRRLNPKLFDNDHLVPEVRKQLLEIARDFVDFMGIDDLKVADVRIYGSNVGFNYTPHSDIDLHVLIDMSDIEDDEVYRELFNAKKILYNLKHPITVRGYDVELYAQDKDDVVKSGGEYSVTDRKWIKYPGRHVPTFEMNEVRSKFKKLVAAAELALRGQDLELLDQLLDTLKKYRQAGLAKGGEFSPENLAYKALRSRGIVDKLYKHRDKLRSIELSIDEDFHPNDRPPGPEFKPTMPSGTVRVDVSDVYDWYKLGQHISDLEGLGKHDFGKGPPSTILSFGDEDLEHKYINNLMKTGLTTTDIDPAGHKKIKGQKVDPTYNVAESQNNSAVYKYVSYIERDSRFYNTWKFDSEEQAQLWIRGKNIKKGDRYRYDRRIEDDLTDKQPVPEDIFESYHNFLASMEFDYSDCPKHSDFVKNNTSWLSYRQKIYKFLWESQGEIELKHIINTLYKNVWKVKSTLNESADTNSLFDLMYGAFGHSDNTLLKKDKVVDIIEVVSMTDGVAQITTHSDVKIKEMRKIGNAIYIMDYDGEIYIEGKNILGRDISLIIVGKPGSAERGLTLLRLKLDIDQDNNKRWGKWIIDFPEENGFGNRLFNKFRIKESASGYIPSNAERDDPRFKTALTVDIGPDSIRDNAIKLGLGSIKRSGVPRIARTDGKLKKR